MSAAIKLVAEKRMQDGWERIDYTPEWHTYAIFGVLADQRNMARAPVIAEPRHVPADWPEEPPYEMGHYEAWGAWADLYDLGDGVKSWLTLDELLGFDYDQVFTNMRKVPPEAMSVRDHVGPEFFEDLQQMQALGVERIVFRIG